MKPLSPPDFARVYEQAVADVYAHWTPEMQSAISKHNVGWSSEDYDFQAYLRASVPRYLKAYESIHRHAAGPSTRGVCDVGGFWGVWPLTLARCGVNVAMTEVLGYFGTAFDPLFGFLRSQGVQIYDYDPFGDSPPPAESFDAVTLMAVLEHYPHSLKRVMTHVKELTADDGLLYIEVPNIAYWPRRVELLKGRSPLPPLRTIYASEEPFTGHHHEFTAEELRELARWTGLTILDEDAYTYSMDRIRPSDFLRSPRAWPVGPRALPGRLLTAAVLRTRPRAREVLTITCRKPAGA